MSVYIPAQSNRTPWIPFCATLPTRNRTPSATAQQEPQRTVPGPKTTMMDPRVVAARSFIVARLQQHIRTAFVLRT